MFVVQDKGLAKRSCCFYTQDKITFLIVRSIGKRFPVDYPLDKLEELLDPVAFFASAASSSLM